LRDPISKKKKQHKKGLVEWLKVKALCSNPRTAKTGFMYPTVIPVPNSPTFNLGSPLTSCEAPSPAHPGPLAMRILVFVDVFAFSYGRMP
jgi:hypothetical protein